MGTSAALANPSCNKDAVTGWGVVPFITENGGPYCVKPAPKDNGGATAPGVTATTIKVAVMLPNDTQLAGASSKPTNRSTGATGTVKDSVLDEWAPYEKFYEQWGRKVEWDFITSTGDDETAQRADAVKVVEAKPFFLLDVTPNGLTTLQQVVAKNKIVVYCQTGTSFEDTINQAPYRWSQLDSQGGALLTAEWAGKQLAAKKAQWAGSSDLTSKTRRVRCGVQRGDRHRHVQLAVQEERREVGDAGHRVHDDGRRLPRRPDVCARAGPDHRHEAEDRGGHHRVPLRRLQPDQGAHRRRHAAGLAP